jgi:hypothetical protein
MKPARRVEKAAVLIERQPLSQQVIDMPQTLLDGSEQRCGWGGRVLAAQAVDGTVEVVQGRGVHLRH